MMRMGAIQFIALSKIRTFCGYIAKSVGQIKKHIVGNHHRA
jgi:hypothetical protein